MDYADFHGFYPHNPCLKNDKNSLVSRLTFRLESQGVEAHLFDHGYQSVGTGGGKVLFQADFLDKIEIGIHYFLRCMIG